MPFWHGDQAGRPGRTRDGDRQARSRPARDPAAGGDRSAGPPARSRHHRRRERACAISTIRRPPVPSPTTARSSSSDASTISATGASACCRRSAAACMRRGRWRSPPRSAASTGMDVEVMWGDEGFVVRFPEVERPPDPALLLPEPEEIEGLVLRQLGSTSLFAARFRETAARALLLPRRRPGMRTPLWQQRKRASDLLAVASRFGSFPALLETYREVLRDHFDMPALVDIAAPGLEANAARRDDRFERAVAVRGVAALQLCRQLHLRRRCPAGRTAGAGALGRSGPAPRTAWRRGAARAARPGRARHGRAAAPAPRREPEGQDRRRHSRSPAPDRRPDTRGDRGAHLDGRRRGRDRRARARAANHRGPSRR